MFFKVPYKKFCHSKRNEEGVIYLVADEAKEIFCPHIPLVPPLLSPRCTCKPRKIAREWCHCLPRAHSSNSPPLTDWSERVKTDQTPQNQYELKMKRTN